MSGCSLHEAFPDETLQTGRIARKEERKKAQKCLGPALSFLKASETPDPVPVPDPDRQNLRPLPPSDKLKGRDGFLADQNLAGETVNDVIGKRGDNYFGRSENDDAFADFSKSLNDNPGYELVPKNADFTNSFSTGGLEKASGSADLPTPSIDDMWKPLSPGGGRTSFFESLPAVERRNTISGNDSFSREEKETLLKKLDTLFARLEDIESRRNENAHVEVTLFILSGLFLMFGLEAVRKLN